MSTTSVAATKITIPGANIVGMSVLMLRASHPTTHQLVPPSGLVTASRVRPPVITRHFHRSCATIALCSINVWYVHCTHPHMSAPTHPSAIASLSPSSHDAHPNLTDFRPYGPPYD